MTTGTTAPVARFFRSFDRLFERVEPTWWGGVLTDSRFPEIHDLNYAYVEGAQPDLRLREVEDHLLPALRRSGARHGHLVLFQPEGCPAVIEDMERSGRGLSWDTAMRFAGPPPADEGGPSLPVEAIPPGGELWRLLDAVFLEFGVQDASVRERLVAVSRDVLEPAGRRWFGVREGRDVLGLGSIQVLDGVGYIDDVMTLPDHRRRGVATAVVRRLAREGFQRGAGEVVLLADEPDPIRLYHALGFEDLGRLASALWPLEPNAPGQESGSSGSGAASSSPGPAAARRDPGSAHGVQPG